MPQEAIRRVSVATRGALGMGGEASRRVEARGDPVVPNDIDPRRRFGSPAAEDSRRRVRTHPQRAS
ncbi:hypothetical protein [Amycolatopsis benzoatilytica]|uniref:hypothetical protein n=1 Tax=Amycolatopsis benzoatilytica TaxID=346045 RepID=UPI0003A973D9|nr:hypothetical protein [Amycolatopsis benzoatilytica]